MTIGLHLAWQWIGVLVTLGGGVPGLKGSEVCGGAAGEEATSWCSAGAKGAVEQGSTAWLLRAAGAQVAEPLALLVLQAAALRRRTVAVPERLADRGNLAGGASQVTGRGLFLGTAAVAGGGTDSSASQGVVFECWPAPGALST